MEVTVGSQAWSIEVPPEKAVELRRAAIPSVPKESPREQVRAALEKPFGTRLFLLRRLGAKPGSSPTLRGSWPLSQETLRASD